MNRQSGNCNQKAMKASPERPCTLWIMSQQKDHWRWSYLPWLSSRKCKESTKKLSENIRRRCHRLSSTTGWMRPKKCSSSSRRNSSIAKKSWNWRSSSKTKKWMLLPKYWTRQRNKRKVERSSARQLKSLLQLAKVKLRRSWKENGLQIKNKNAGRDRDMIMRKSS